MASSLRSYQDVIRSVAKKLATDPASLKSTVLQVSKVYTSVSKYLNYIFKTYSDLVEVEIPQLGFFILDGGALYFRMSAKLTEETRLQTKDKHDTKKYIKKELNLGKVGEICLIERGQVRNILGQMANEIVRISVLYISLNRARLSSKDWKCYWISSWRVSNRKCL